MGRKLLKILFQIRMKKIKPRKKEAGKKVVKLTTRKTDFWMMMVLILLQVVERKSKRINKKSNKFQPELRVTKLKVELQLIRVIVTVATMRKSKRRLMEVTRIALVEAMAAVLNQLEKLKSEVIVVMMT